MGVLIAAVVLVAVLLALDLVLTFGVIKRLRAHVDLIGKALEGRGTAPRPMLAAGETAGDFVASAVDDGTVTRSAFTERTLVGFFAVGCGTCTEKMPEFTGYAGNFARDRVLAVVQGDGDEAAEYVGRLTPFARVVVEPFNGPVSRAFAVKGTPAMAVVDTGGRVVASGLSVDDLPGLVKA